LVNSMNSMKWLVILVMHPPLRICMIWFAEQVIGYEKAPVSPIDAWWLEPRSRHFAQRSLCAAAIRALPSSDLGPVLLPPWNLQRRLPGSDFNRHGWPFRVFAPQGCRNLAVCFCARSMSRADCRSNQSCCEFSKTPSPRPRAHWCLVNIQNLNTQNREHPLCGPIISAAYNRLSFPIENWLAVYPGLGGHFWLSKPSGFSFCFKLCPGHGIVTGFQGHPNIPIAHICHRFGLCFECKDPVITSRFFAPVPGHIVLPQIRKDIWYRQCVGRHLNAGGHG